MVRPLQRRPEFLRVLLTAQQRRLIITGGVQVLSPLWCRLPNVLHHPAMTALSPRRWRPHRTQTHFQNLSTGPAAPAKPQRLVM
jgi:hypothetical protein